MRIQTDNYAIKWYLILLLLLTSGNIGKSQTYPSFGTEKPVTIIGLTTDAMEPFISPDGNYLFYNNLNDGINTRLFYAERINDSTFNFVGELNGTNQPSALQLDAVAGLDTANNFYWVSLRDYPLEFDNLFHGTFDSGNVTNIGRLHGDFYIYFPGWLLMDHGISYNGQLLYFNNARFDGDNCPGPCETRIGVAQKENDSTFMMLPNSNQIMQTVNDPDYKNYAPAVTNDELELYYTRFLKGPITANSIAEMCVVVRNSPTDNFSAPEVLFSSNILSNFAEAPTLTTDKQIMYYHKKVGGVYKIMMRTRDQSTGIVDQQTVIPKISITPNPMQDKSVVKIDNTLNKSYSLYLLDHLGRTVRIFLNISTDQVEIYRNNLSPGLYIVQLRTENEVLVNQKLIIK